MEIPLLVFFVLLGGAIGSFLNVCIDRLPARKSVVSPPSRCDSCGKRLAFRDMVPIVSYLLLRGRCRHCGAHISPRNLWVEVIGAVLLGLIFWRFGMSARFAITALYCYIFVAIAFIDLEHKLILNRVTYPAAVYALIVLAVESALPSARLYGGLFYFPEPAILSGVIGGAIGFFFFLVVYLIYPRGMGMGDVKLAGLIGLAVGFPMVLVALFIGIFIGGVFAIALLLLKLRERKGIMPYGTFLAIGPVVTLLWGNEILAWYLGFF